MAGLPFDIDTLSPASRPKWNKQTVTYSFLTNQDNSNSNGTEKWKGFQVFSVAERIATALVFDVSSAVSNIKFEHRVSGGDIILDTKILMV